MIQLAKADLPQEKMRRYGAQQLTDIELLALFLRTGIKGKSVLEVAQVALDQLGGWQGLINASCAQFCDIPGLGEVKYTQLHAAVEITKRYFFARIVRGEILKNSRDTQYFLSAKLRHYSHEVFACIYLDSHHHIIHFAELFHGTLNSAHIHPREVVKNALSHNAAAIIFAHNHPSGHSEPSAEDIRITKQLKTVLALVDVKVLDHIIIGDLVVSLAQRGLI